jgi:hypothetical protein
MSPPHTTPNTCSPASSDESFVASKFGNRLGYAPRPPVNHRQANRDFKHKMKAWLDDDETPAVKALKRAVSNPMRRRVDSAVQPEATTYEPENVKVEVEPTLPKHHTPTDNAAHLGPVRYKAGSATPRPGVLESFPKLSEPLSPVLDCAEDEQTVQKPKSAVSKLRWFFDGGGK